MGTIATQITSPTIVYSTVYSDADQRKHQSSASLAFVRGIHRGPVNSSHKWPETRKMFPFDYFIKHVAIPEDYSGSLKYDAHHIPEFLVFDILLWFMMIIDFVTNESEYT